MREGVVRARVCGVLIENNEILLLKHQGLGPSGYLWSFPGGGIEFGEDSRQCLVREVLEETGLNVDVEKFLFVNEYKDHRFHAIELFYSIKRLEGELLLGSDPELDQQILVDIDFFSDNDLSKIEGNCKHNIFSEALLIKDIIKLNGCYNFDQT